MRPDQKDRASALLLLPTRNGSALRIFAPTPEEAPTTVDPLIDVDAVGPVQSFLGALCTGARRASETADGDAEQAGPLTELPTRLIEILLVADASGVKGTTERLEASLRAFQRLPALYTADAILPGLPTEWHLLASAEPGAPLLYCRKRNVIFAARSPRTAEALAPVPVVDLASTIPLPLVSTDAADRNLDGAALYAFREAETPFGQTASLETLMVDQGRLRERVVALRTEDPLHSARVAEAHACVACPEHDRCYPGDDGYAYVTDRLTPITIACTPTVTRPFGEWRLEEAARIIGGSAASAVAESSESLVGRDARSWRQALAARMEQTAPTLHLAGEDHGRPLLEIARLRLRLIADVLEQLECTWRATQHPHLIWTEDTIRVAWEQSAGRAATGWGFHAILRHMGLHPTLRFDADGDDVEWPYPPTESEESRLPADVVEASRYFQQEISATLFVQQVKAVNDERAEIVEALLEDTGIANRLFVPGDRIEIESEGWTAILSPTETTEEHGRDDEPTGVVLRGMAKGDVSTLSDGATLTVRFRWTARFGHFADLYAVGLSLFEALLATDERSGVAMRDAIIEDVQDLVRVCRQAPTDQRGSALDAWIVARCSRDEPAERWTRRNLLHERDARASTDLSAFPAMVWQAICAFGFRLMVALPGVGFCADRAQDVARTESGTSVPLLELRGLIALLDDLVFRRRSPGGALAQLLAPPEE